MTRRSDKKSGWGAVKAPLLGFLTVLVATQLIGFALLYLIVHVLGDTLDYP